MTGFGHCFGLPLGFPLPKVVQWKGSAAYPDMDLDRLLDAMIYKVRCIVTLDTADRGRAFLEVYMRIWQTTHRRIARFVAIGVIGLAPLASAVPAMADTPPASSEPMGLYVLEITPQNGVGTDRIAVLRCGPDGGTHPNAVTACGQLYHTDGEIGSIPMGSGMCPMIWMPVKVTAVGLWNGEPRYYERTFPNRCVAARSTGGVIFMY
jgi:Subtilisin inhibitor-like